MKMTHGHRIYHYIMTAVDNVARRALNATLAGQGWKFLGSSELQSISNLETRMTLASCIG